MSGSAPGVPDDFGALVREVPARQGGSSSGILAGLTFAVKDRRCRCGIWGFRPTFGAIPVDGTVSLGESFDTVGVFARATRLLRDVSLTLLGNGLAGSVSNWNSAITFGDAAEHTDDAGRWAVEEALRKLERLGL